MYITHIAEVALTALLFLSRVWSRPTEVACDGGRKEGDKWFDGCRWCVCQGSGQVCSSSECSVLVSQVQPCKTLHSSWQDGCYSCKCHQSGIDCTADQTCATLMRNKQLGPPFLSPVACVQPKDDRCVCGIDSVPSCTAEVIDKNSYTAITVELTPTFSSFKNAIVPTENMIPGPSNRNIQTAFDVAEIGSENSQETEEPITNDHSLEEESITNNQQVSTTETVTSQTQYQSSQSSHTGNSLSFVNPYLKTNQTKNYSHESESAETKRGPILERQSSGSGYSQSSGSGYSQSSGSGYSQSSGSGYSQSSGSGYSQSSGSGYSQSSGSGYSQSSDSLKTNQNSFDESLRDTTADNLPPSLLVVSANLCRWGERWYGGGLRCYCGQDNSITCGDPSFVVARIDEFRPREGACQAGPTWEDMQSCTECQCQISGLAFCRRSPSCPLPFLIKPVSEDTAVDFEISGNDKIQQKQRDNTRSTHKSLVHQTASNKVNKIPPHEADNLDNWGTNIRISQSSHTFDVSSGDIDETGSIFNNEYGSGNVDEIHFTFNTEGPGHVKTETITVGAQNNHQTDHGQNKSAEYLQIYLTSPPNIVEDSKKNPADDVLLTTQTLTSTPIRIEHPTRPEMQPTPGDGKASTKATMRECKPKSRWIDGCKRCQCSQAGQKQCDDSRCPKAIATDPHPSTGDCRDQQHGRPVQCPPANVALNRDYPVDLNNVNQCGRFKPGDVYWEDCNICSCTSQGPKCTAKNCT